MSGWTTHTGLAVALDRENVDTDQLIPARFMSTPRSEGYGDFLLHDMRKNSDGTAVSDFPLNKVPNASILVSRRNFGSGSSREAAVYALVDFGISVVIAPSFGDIFASNSVNNGLLPARVAEADAVAAIAKLADGPQEVSVDLSDKTIRLGNTTLEFTLDDVWQQKLINGWDDIDLTHNHKQAIAAFRAQHVQQMPWAIPVQQNDFRSAGRDTVSQ
ncbi:MULTISPECIES: 3-isopropylmalate dehydratase small subunit [Marivita]|uniref:3-isopropylmalate dehydratase n=1 Tax=Marivita cryptomonadis TaxID=505252 RepID=A0A9Q2P018_9RHOB|nr:MULTISPECIES: 3-isopropylmalate dehydratase small subunit [Marivita]MCR9169457.1 3-isopropylmalate dehydratase small subunit [Paracoccaceae bacterium]MBM2320131.1 3-isopropylmalate dehydratase small subunit [Marivita cryptomonadis]MBM2329710.1 3-isopropylmalate dehydratase small subunit [Marivita cryptomonadis]MBM2339298.1 3-isopropylmalate dehydratase small subunit [Marivita cryptomonadis]MBM2343956.1 3-isopropylmalate dehydratase small subunit [Marivita cryptomonadis]